MMMVRSGVTKRQRELMSQIEACRPRTGDGLYRMVDRLLGIRVPRRAIIEGHQPPFEYLKASFFEPGFGDEEAAGCGSDLVVWANRGGGKTFLGALATLLDLIFKPGVQVRILGGSREQSSRMYAYLLRMTGGCVMHGILAREPTQRRLELVNGSVVEVLSQSARSVRGLRVHKLRCDEVELFDRQVWDAAQLVTSSGRCGDVWVRGVVEALSTMHLPFGLMNELVDRSVGDGGSARLVRWGAMDVIERCPEERACSGCVLWDDCGGRAKEAEGFVKVDDLIAQRERSGDEVWSSEMMCQRPRVTHSVYPDFDPEVGGKHVTVEAGGGVEACEGAGERVASDAAWIGGMDFGLRSPLVMLWARLSGGGGSDAMGVCVDIVDEYVQRGKTLDTHVGVIGGRGWPRPVWIGVDPAGLQRNSQTGLTDIDVMKRAGYKILKRSSLIKVGIGCIRRRLDRGLLRIHPRCVGLIQALTVYHFPVDRPDCDDPVKDGPDHLCDALRYMITNLESQRGEVEVRSYI